MGHTRRAQGAVQRREIDIGPEQIIPKRDKLWAGEWVAEAMARVRCAHQ